MRGMIVPGIGIPTNAREGYNTGMHSIRTPRGGFGLKRKRENTPPWFFNEKKVQAFLKHRFPKLRTDLKQQHRASIWYVLIDEWFAHGYSETKIMKRYPDLFTDRRQLSRQVQMIRFAAKGLRLDGRAPTGRPKGRPTKERRKLIRASLSRI